MGCSGEPSKTKSNLIRSNYEQMMKKYACMFILAFFVLAIRANTNADSLKAAADKAYSLEQYDQAASLYLRLTRIGESDVVCYNLANSYYRMDSLASAILWYERALLLSPGDSDIRFNLRMARAKTVDKIVPEEEIFFARWYHSLLNQMSVNNWVWTGVLFFALALAALLLYFQAGRILWRKVGFFGSLIFLVFAVCSHIFAWQQKGRQQHRDRAVVMQPSVVVKSTPNAAGTDLFLLHSGTSFQLLDQSMKDWCQIRLSDGKEGWIPVSAIEVI